MLQWAIFSETWKHAMRADRLLALLMLLQTRGTVTAQTLASTLEVTERTVYRDVTALSAAGVPVYTVRGPGGGITLLEEYRTNLTGLTPSEVQALFMLSIPSELDQLGVGDALRVALLKLSAALPDSRRAEESSARRKIHLDSSGWDQSAEPLPYLKTIQSALWRDQPLELLYQSDFGAGLPMRLEPYGLVAKASNWYLVAAREANLRVLRVSRILEAHACDGNFIRPANFDLPAFWKAWCQEFELARPRYTVTARVLPQLAAQLTGGSASLQGRPPDLSVSQNWQILTLNYESLESARDQLLAYGGAIEVLDPPALRRSLIDYARQILYRYRESLP